MLTNQRPVANGWAYLTRVEVPDPSEVPALAERELLAALLHPAGGYVMVLDARGVVRFTSHDERGAESAVGTFGTWDLTDRSLSSWLDLSRRVLAGVQDVLWLRSPSFTMEYWRGSGSERRCFEMRAERITAWDGVVIVQTDVTPRRRAAGVSGDGLAGERSADAAGVWELDPATGELWIDPDLEGQLGYGNGNGRGRMRWTSLVHPDDLESVASHLQEHLSGASPTFEVEHRVLRRDGSSRRLVARGHAVERVNGQPRRVVGTWVDVAVRPGPHTTNGSGSPDLVARLDRANRELRSMAARLVDARETERRRIAQELHDGIHQEIAGLAIEASVLQSVLPAEATEASASATLLESRLAELAATVRDISHDMHPPRLDAAGLADSLYKWCSDLERRRGLQTEAAVGELPEGLAADVARHLYRIAQEALHNVVSHAGTDRARLRIRATDRNVLMVIADRGRGFDPATVRSAAGLGVETMAERARMLGGRLEVRGRPGAGTSVRVAIPLRGD